jgi:hypothetical protein
MVVTAVNAPPQRPDIRQAGGLDQCAGPTYSRPATGGKRHPAAGRRHDCRAAPPPDALS